MRSRPPKHPQPCHARPTRVRFGGIPARHGFRFELSGGRPCLDFVNTLDERLTDRPVERLRQFGDLVSWAAQTQAISRQEVAMLRRYGLNRPRAAQAALRRATMVREAIFAVCSAASQRRNIAGPAFAALAESVSRAARRRHIQRRGNRFAWGWQPMTRVDPDLILMRAAWSAADLLTSPAADRIRQCAGPGCAWLFLDTSKNRSRRWCDMTVCGNRIKARRFYAKRKRSCAAAYR